MSVRNKQVRVVESDRTRARMLEEWLSGYFETEVASTGGEALDKIDDETAVVVLSQALSDVRAGEFLEGLRADGYDCRVVLLAKGGVVAEYEGGSFDRVLEGPLDPESLREAVDAVADVPASDTHLPDPVLV